MFDFSSYSAKSKYYDDSNKLVAGKMIDKTGGVAIENLVLPKIYLFLVDLSVISEYKKSKGCE